jgi:hypothetical protein
MSPDCAAKKAVQLVDEEYYAYHPPEKKCKRCKKKYYPKKEGQLYCSLRCRTEADKKKYAQEHGKIKKKKCIICGKSFLPKNRSPQTAYCSKECSRSERNKLNLTKSIVREYFFERANFACQECGASGIHLECHHIEPIYKGGKDIVRNIIVLCDKCHQKAHRII